MLSDRLATFKDCPFYDAIRPCELAGRDFCYCRECDDVVCCICGLGLANRSAIELSASHKQVSPHCPSFGTTNIHTLESDHVIQHPADVGPWEHPLHPPTHPSSRGATANPNRPSSRGARANANHGAWDQRHSFGNLAIPAMALVLSEEDELMACLPEIMNIYNPERRSRISPPEDLEGRRRSTFTTYPGDESQDAERDRLASMGYNYSGTKNHVTCCLCHTTYRYAPLQICVFCYCQAAASDAFGF